MVSGNVARTGGQPFPNVPAHVIFTAETRDNREVRVGLFGVSVNSNPAASDTQRLPRVRPSDEVGFLTRNNPDVSGVMEHGDIRKALIAQVRGRGPGGPTSLAQRGGPGG